MIQLVVFDMAGTTVYDGDAVNICLRDALAGAGAAVTRDEVNAVMGMPKPLAIRRLLTASRASVVSDAEVAAVHDDFVRRMIGHYQEDTSVEPCAGAEDVFEWLERRDIKVALDTGFDRTIANAILERLGWSRSGLIDVTVTSDEVARGRPHPDMIERAMLLCGVVDRHAVAKVGDTPADLRQGAAAGCALVVGVTSGSHSRAQLAEVPHTHLIDRLAELPPLLPRAPRLFTPGPLTTSATVKGAMLRDVGSRDLEFIETVRAVRTELLALAGTSKDDGFEAVLIPGSGTYGIEAMLGTLVPADGCLLVVENGAYGARMASIAQRLKIDNVRLESPEHRAVEVASVAQTVASIPCLTHVAIVHCETTSGVVNPVEAIGQVVHARGLTYLVDAMSAFGGIPIDVKAARIDALAASSNKCIEGVPGLAFVLARRALLESAEGQARSVSLDLADQWRGFERDGQFRFTPPTHVVLAFARALHELDAEGGVAARYARYGALQLRLVSGMRRLGFEEYVPSAEQGPIITSFNYLEHASFDFRRFYDALRERGHVIYPGKVSQASCFRIGTIGRLSVDDVDDLLHDIDIVLRDMGVEARSPAGEQQDPAMRARMA